MKQPPLDSRSLQSIFMLLLLAQLAFLGVVLTFMRESNSFLFQVNNLFHWALPVGIVALDMVATTAFKQRLAGLNDERELLDKINGLQGAYIVLWVMVQAGTFLLLGFAILESNDYYILLAVAQILYYITLRPRLFNFSEEL